MSKSVKLPTAHYHILELARSMALSYAVWMGLTSPLTRYLQYDPHDPGRFIGFNPRVITEGIMPFMVVTEDMIFDAITSLSSLWYHDYICTYMALMEDKANEAGSDGVLLEYPFASNMVRIAHRKKFAEGLINPQSVKYKGLNSFLYTNFEDSEGRLAQDRRRVMGNRINNRNLGAERAGRQAYLQELM